MPLSEQEEFELLSLKRKRGELAEQPVRATSFRERMASLPIELATSGGPVGVAAKAVGKGLEGLNTVADVAGSGATELASRAGLSPEASAALGVGTNMVVGAVPAGLGGGLGGMAGREVGPSLGRSLMTSALKPSKADVLRGKAGPAVDTLLDYGVNVSRGGQSALKDAVGGLDDAISGIVNNSTGMVDKAQVIKNLKPVLDNAKLQLGIAKTRDQVRQALLDFWNHPSIASGRYIPVQKAHEMKRAFYKELSDKAYGKGVENLAYDEAEKGLARGLKEGVAKAEPDAAALLKEQAKLANALKMVNNRLPTELNKNPLGLGWLGENALAAAGFMFDRSALLKSLAARAAYSSAENAGRIGGATLGALYRRDADEQNGVRLSDLSR